MLPGWWEPLSRKPVTCADQTPGRGPSGTRAGPVGLLPGTGKTCEARRGCPASAHTVSCVREWRWPKAVKASQLSSLHLALWKARNARVAHARALVGGVVLAAGRCRAGGASRAVVRAYIVAMCPAWPEMVRAARAAKPHAPRRA
jgi:hypothetical protein